MWGGRSIVFLRDFRSAPGLRNQFLLGQEIIGEDPVEFPNLVEQLELSRGVVAEVADKFTDSGPVLLLDMGPVVLVA